MPSQAENYFVYLPQAPSKGLCPCVATAAGFTRVPPDSPYPPQRHPLDHHFTWSNGRVLHSFQIVLITAGSGTFESSASRQRLAVEPGTLFLLFPGVWHRYAPDTKTGWTEHWIECRGPAFNRALRGGVIRQDKPLLNVGMNRDLLDAFALCHRWARRPVPARSLALATLGLHLLSILEDAGSAPPSHVDTMVQQAQGLISERFQERLDMQAVARELCVGYSNLRQNFKSRTGLSLKQFHLQVRLQHAQDLLANSDRSVKEIAEILGFDSPYHLSGQFKARTGLSPRDWRMKLRVARNAAR